VLVLLIEEEDNTSVNLRFSLAMQAVSHQDQPGCRSKRLLAGLLAKSDIAGILCLHILSKLFSNRCAKKITEGWTKHVDKLFTAFSF
jgi:hypothetical protein